MKMKIDVFVYILLRNLHILVIFRSQSRRHYGWSFSKRFKGKQAKYSLDSAIDSLQVQPILLAVITTY